MTVREHTPKSILLTRGCGYVASHTAVVLQEAGYGAVLVGNLSNSRHGVVDAITQITSVRPQFYGVDCIDTVAMGEIFEHHKGGIERVIHLAAHRAVGESVEQPLRYYDSNINSLITLLHCMERYDVQHLVFSSSCAVYGQPTAEHLSITESAPRQDTTSPYDNTRHISRGIITDSMRSSMPLQAATLRYFNSIGVHPSVLVGGGPVGTPQNLIPFLTQTVAGLHKGLVVSGNDYNTLDGTYIRDYIDVMDLAQARLAALHRLHRSDVGSTPAHYICNVGMGRGLSVLRLIQTFERAIGRAVPYRIGDRRTDDIEQIWADTSYGEQEPRWYAKIPIKEGLRRAWYWQEALDKRHIN